MTLVSKFESHCCDLILCMSMQSLYLFFYICIDTNHKNLFLLKLNPTFLVSPVPITPQMANRSTEVIYPLLSGELQRITGCCSLKRIYQ